MSYVLLAERARMNQKTKATSMKMCSLVKQLFVKSLLIKRLKAFYILIERGLFYTDYTANVLQAMLQQLLQTI